MELAGFSIEHFLRDYWQKHPLLIRNPWKNWQNPLLPDELAGLACEQGIESRLVIGQQGNWGVEHGPFPEARFVDLSRDPWTLLVQAVDHSVPDVATLLEAFRFIPNWRIDDVMVSYASDGGGVGPHFDQYDVFLIQGLGSRRWQIGGLCDAATPLLPNDDLRLLANFQPTDEWVLDPGDMLYVPPRWAHNGIAVGDDCMTYSIGFRAPSRAELLAHWCDHLLAEIQEDDRYTDPARTLQAASGEIASADLGVLHAMVVDTLLDRAAFARWFGEYSSARKYPDHDFAPDVAPTLQMVLSHARAGHALHRNPASRFSFMRKTDESVTLFVDGESFDLTGSTAIFAEQLTGAPVLCVDHELPHDTARLVKHLIAMGSVQFDPGE